MPKVSFHTLGCRLNQYETDSLATDFRRAGYEIVEFGEKTDVCVVNTCTVTDKSDRKSRNAINRAGRSVFDSESIEEATENGAENAVVVVTGCYVENNRELVEHNERVTYVVDNEHKNRIFDLVDGHFRGEIVHPNRNDGNRFGFGDARSGFHTRSTVKIQDGCDNFCTFCIIPYVRGRAESRPAPKIRYQIREMIDRGAKEIVLTGVNMGRYSYEGTTFTGLVESILELPGDFRLRLSSLEPEITGDGLIELIGHEKFCPHLHLCLQSGSERVLLSMRRQYTAAEYRALTDSIRDRYPDFNLTTDILVGFPGETEEDFEQTCRTAREIGFTHIHTFPYSIRTGTRAARMNNQISEKEKSRRGRIIREISDENKRSYRSGMIGTTETMLVERVRNGELSGYGEHYVPIVVPADAIDRSGCDGPGDTNGCKMRNTFLDVRITGIRDEKEPLLCGNPVS